MKGGYNGNGYVDVEGEYDDKVLCDESLLLRKFYEERLEFKKNKDPREYTIKIIINTYYGMKDNIVFTQFYDRVAAGDCTRIGRQLSKKARKLFADLGYHIIYTDTDSVYLLDPFNNEERLLSIRDDFIKEIKANVPFPYIHFDMGVDDKIEDIWFFDSKDGNEKEKKSDSEMDEFDQINKSKGFMKKNYIYITEDKKLKYKNLGVKKKSNSELSRYIFNKILVPKIIEERKVQFPREFYETLILELLQTNPELIAKRFRVSEAETYKSKTCPQYQIASRYGPGIHFLIKNTKYGVCKSVKYCTFDEFKSQNLTFNDLDLSGVWKELVYFIYK